MDERRYWIGPTFQIHNIVGINLKLRLVVFPSIYVSGIENCLVANIEFQYGKIVHPAAKTSAQMIHHNIPVIDGGRISKMWDNLMQHIMQNIVGTQKIDPIPRSVPLSFVHSVVNTFVRFADPVGDTILIFFDNIDCPVLGTSVDNNIFYVGICLSQYAEDCLFQRGCTVVNDGNNTDERIRGGCFQKIKI